jgi:hypothetical protein
MNRRHLAALLMLLACASPGIAFPRENCQDKLVGNSYDCTTLQPFSGGVAVVKICAQFVTGKLSNNFDFLVGLGSFPYGCACEVTSSSSVNKQFFDFHVLSDAFECVGDPENLVQWHGKVESEKLHGQGSLGNGSIFEFVCKKRSTACPQ